MVKGKTKTEKKERRREREKDFAEVSERADPKNGCN